MLKARDNQLPFLTGICIGSVRKRPKNMIIYEPKDANESAREREEPINIRVNMQDKHIRIQKKQKANNDQYLRPLSLTSLSSAIRAFNRLRKDIVEGYCSLLASISFNSNCIS
jgi:hypothetical protein